MDEETRNTETMTRIEPTDTEAHASADMIAKANDAADRLEAANRERARLLQKEEQLRVEQTFAGKADASQPKPAEESPEDYAKKVLQNAI